MHRVMTIQKLYFYTQAGNFLKQEQNYGERQKCPVQYIRTLFTTNYFLLLFME